MIPQKSAQSQTVRRMRPKRDVLSVTGEGKSPGRLPPKPRSPAQLCVGGALRKLDFWFKELNLC